MTQLNIFLRTCVRSTCDLASHLIPQTRSTMNLLSVDPGISTGVVVLKSDGEVVCERVLVDTVDRIVEEAQAMHLGHDCDEVVIEKGPTLERQNSSFMERLDAGLRGAFPRATWMRPGDWKPTPRGKANARRLSSIHTRDAYRMGLEHLHRSRRRSAA